MAWNGTHGAVSLAIAKLYLPPAPCRICLYAFRVAVGSKSLSRSCAGHRCSRCDITWPADIHTNPLTHYALDPKRWSTR